MKKKCIRCGVEKEKTRENFYTKGGVKGEWFASFCIECAKAYQKRYSAAHPKPKKGEDAPNVKVRMRRSDIGEHKNLVVRPPSFEAHEHESCDCGCGGYIQDGQRIVRMGPFTFREGHQP